MHTLAPLIHDLAIMLGVAGLVVILFQRIHQPVVLGYLAAGMIVGPLTASHHLITDSGNIKILSELGVIFLMFSLGLEFSFNKLSRLGFATLITGIIDVSLMMFIGYATASAFGWQYHDRLFLGAALAISSTTIIFKAVNDLGVKTRRFAEVIFGVLIVEDLLAILLLVGLTLLVSNENLKPLDIIFSVGRMVLVVGGWFLIGYSLVPTLFRRVASYISQETLTIVSVALCLFLVTIAAYFHYSSALGAFIMGSILAETVLVNRIEELIVPIRDVFGAIFFISVGMLINPAIILAHWESVLMISFILITGKVTVVGLATFLTGQSINTSVRAGFGMAQIGEFSFIIATLGWSLHAINDQFYPIIVAVSSITTFTTPYLIRFSGQLGSRLERMLPTRIKYGLDGYTHLIYRMKTRHREKPHTIALRCITNAITIALIFTFIHKAGFPYAYRFMEGNSHHAKLLCEIFSMALSSPFIWGMIFSWKLEKKSDSNKPPMTSKVFLIWLITLLEIIFLSVVYFHTWLTTASFLILLVLFFIVAYRQLEKSYQWFEAQLLRNINHSQKKDCYQEIAPWDMHFVEIKVGNHSPFINKSLGESRIREQFGVNVVAIFRGHNTLLAPRGDMKLYDNDKLIVLGTDDQIDRFKLQATLIKQDTECAAQLENFILQPVLLEADNPLIGQSIRNSGIREKWQGLVMGIERGKTKILNPDPETILQLEDLVLIVVDKLRIPPQASMT